MEFTTLQRFLRNHSRISLVAFQWVDYCGHLRARMLTRRHALELEELDGSVSAASCHMTVLPDGHSLPDWPVCDVQHFRPDWQSLGTISYCDRVYEYAAVQCNLYEEIRGGPSGSYRCPRTTLANILIQALPRTFLLGFEIEFMILESGQIAERTAGYSSASIRHTKVFDVLEDCVKQLERNRISVLAFHAAGTGNQFAISTAPMAPLEAVDALVLTQDIIRGTTARHNYQAIMHPKPFATNASNGMHAKILFQPVDDEDSFIAGILNRLPLLCAFSTPSGDSYRRMAKAQAGAWVSWGTENRDVPLRKICPGRWEIRCFDSTANPYLAMAAYLAAGLTGTKNREELQLRDCDQWISHLEHDGVQTWNITQKMPQSLDESIAYLKTGTQSLGEYIPVELVTRYLHLKEHQLQNFELLP